MIYSVSSSPGARSTPPRIAVIHPRLDGHGGLEKYGVHLIETLAPRFPLDVISEHEVDLGKVERAFGVKLEGPRFLCDPRCDPASVRPSGLGERATRWRAESDYYQMTRKYDLIVAQTVGLPHRSGARRSLLLCHFPVVRGLRVKPQVPHTGWRALMSADSREQRVIRGRLDSWDCIISNSEFTRKWVQRYWHRTPEIINPPIALPPAASSEKRSWIVGAGSFGLPDRQNSLPWSYKRQEVLIDAFRRLCDAGVTGWELHLAGHVLPPTPEVFAYVEELKARAGDYPIHFHANCPHSELTQLYRYGSIFWHATGYGLDPDESPEKMEHFGMVTAEAMGWGCVPVVVNCGGQPEIVSDGECGFLWGSLDELRDRTLRLISDRALRRQLAVRARVRAEQFGLERFRRQVNGLIDRELSALGSTVR